MTKKNDNYIEFVKQTQMENENRRREICRNKISAIQQNKRSARNRRLSTPLKGYMHTIEVVIAASIILVGVGLLFKPYTTDYNDDMKQQTYDALFYLDDSGKLRTLIATNNVNAIEAELKNIITYNFKTEICKDVCSAQNLPAKSVVAVDYYISGYRSVDSFKIAPTKLRVYVWE